MAASDASDERVEIDLLQPEILSKECLLELLKHRCVPVDGTENLDRGALVKLYYSCIIPLPKRTYRQNRRGREMTKRQILLGKRKRRHSELSTVSNADTGTTEPKALSSYDSTPERLKPPPSAINFDHKVIKLGASPSSVMNSPPTTPVAQKACTGQSTKSDSSFDFVINSGPRVRSKDDTTLGHVNDSACSVSPQNIVHKADCTTTPGTNTKVKLQRAIDLPPLEVTPMDIEENVELNCDNAKENGTDVTTRGFDDSKAKHHQRSAVSLINATLQAAKDNGRHVEKGKTPTTLQAAKGNTRHVEKGKTPTRKSSGEEPKSDDEVDVLQKKYKKIAVQWP